MFINDDLTSESDHIVDFSLDLVLWAVYPHDVIELRVNGNLLNLHKEDWDWKDAQVYADKPQPNAGSISSYVIDADQNLLMQRYCLKPEFLLVGENTISIRAAKRGPYPCGRRDSRIEVEKIELTVRYERDNRLSM